MTDDLNKIVADLMEMRKGEAQGIMMMANSDDTMFEDCISRLKALAAHRPEERDNICWLIERGQAEGQSPTIWWTGAKHTSGVPYMGMWTENAHEAIRFRTKAEAQGYASTEEVPSTHRITEHVFIMRDNRWIGGSCREVHAPSSPQKTP